VRKCQFKESTQVSNGEGRETAQNVNSRTNMIRISVIIITLRTTFWCTRTDIKTSPAANGIVGTVPIQYWHGISLLEDAARTGNHGHSSFEMYQSPSIPPKLIMESFRKHMELWKLSRCSDELRTGQPGFNSR
jgi:hypothetical protein